MLRVAEDDCLAAQSASSRNVEGRLDLYFRLCGLQSGAHAKLDGRRGSIGVSLSRSVSAWCGNASVAIGSAEKSQRKPVLHSKMIKQQEKFLTPYSFSAAC
jgi:hypothetical protein